MSRRAAWCAIALLPMVVLGGMWLIRRDLTKPNWWIPTQMARSSAYKSQTANPVLAGRATLQPSVEGTLARGQQAFHYGDTDAERSRAGRELANPLPPVAEVLSRGRSIYETFCLVCHGAAGRGDGPLIPKFPNPPDFLATEARRLSDGEVFHILTLGRNKMAAYAAQVPWDDRWAVIHHIRSLQQGSP